MPTTTPKGHATRRRLLDAALDELAANDGQVEFAAVTRRAGTSAGLPYRYFGSKSLMIVALIDEFFDAWEALAYRPTFQEVSDDWWVCECVRIDKTVTFFYEHPLAPLLFTRLGGDAAVMGRMRQRVDAQVRGAAKNVRRGKRLGRVPQHVDAKLSGALLMGGSSQVLALALASDPPLSRVRVARELRDFMQRVLCLEETRT
ncbi:MAG: TetR/AcrR family transcriptional regulator [Myxococcota bacterium]